MQAENTVDYFGIGVIRPLRNQTGHSRPQGVVGFGALVGLMSLPCVAIGGISAAVVPIIRGANVWLYANKFPKCRYSRDSGIPWMLDSTDARHYPHVAAPILRD
jgi:hypothetical protein